jgi:hypothetical protein
MKNPMNWTRSALAGILALSLLGAPQIAAAHDRWDRDGYYDNRGYQGYYYSGDVGPAYRDGYYRYGRSPYYGGDYGYYRSDRSAGKSAAIVGGSAAAGAIFGALAGGGQGAAIGAVIGGIGGLIVDSATKNNSPHR